MALLSKVLKVVCWAGSVFVPNMLLASEDIKQKQNERQRLRDCPAQQLKEQLRSAQVAGQWRGDTALTLPLFWRRSTVSGLFRAVSAVEPFTLSFPSHSVPVPNRPARLCGKQRIQTAASLFPQCPCRGRLFVCYCGRCSCVYLMGEPVSSYFSMACYSILLM